MICIACSQLRQPLYRGLCAPCAPDLHRKVAAVKAAAEVAMQAYEAHTGKQALQHWAAYELWLERRPEGQALASALAALGHYGLAKA